MKPPTHTPFLLTSALDPVEEVLVVENRLTASFVDALRHIIPQTGATLTALHFDDAYESDVWMQDTVEIGRFCVPTEQGVEQFIGVLAGIRSKHGGPTDCKPLDRNMHAYFTDRGAVILEPAAPRPNTRWIDWYGNLEVSPPVPTFPHGRILTGKQGDLSMHPDVLGFLEEQRLQAPALIIDTSWLEIGHVDEVVNFVPAPDGPGFRVLLPSPSLAKQILEEAACAGRHDCPVFAGTNGETTVVTLLEEVASSAENAAIEQRLASTRVQLCEELGIRTNDFAGIPALFRDGVAVIPNGVNSLVCNGHVIIPDPKGPQVDGEDLFMASIRDSLIELGLNIHFVDNWDPYHVRSGEIHCGTNAIRRIRQPIPVRCIS